MDVSIRRISVSVGASLGVLLGLFDVFLLYDFLALDHAPSAVLAGVFSFFTRHATAGTVVVVSDLGADDLFLCLLIGSESESADDSPYEEEDKYEWRSERSQSEYQTY